MAENKYKEKHMAMPIENFATAPLANRDHLQPRTRVNIPNNNEIRNAKDWVDANQK
ncbi:CDIF630_02480 family spore surface protein [Clostridium tunisiense]|uniref:CDIF630_02480 family spore surface protein n=1 Tax=Clostridium tunisiense TaxID=219748 RepID=UPI0003095CCB|nr:DUF3787 domain-containing protein [Clostridium tunisiense]